MHRTPVVVWNNFLPERQETLEMSPSFLGSYVLDKAMLPGTYYTDFLRELSRKTPVIPPKKYFAEMNIDEADMKSYELLQYDSLFGERHAYGDIKDRIVNADYFLGTGPIEIEEVTLGTPKAGADTEITVAGRNIPAQGKLFANGKALETKRDSGGGLTAKAPAGSFKSGGCEVQVKVFDSKDIVVGQSNVKRVAVATK
jgi:hypothetical protein